MTMKSLPRWGVWGTTFIITAVAWGEGLSPVISIRDGLFDHDERRSLGLEILEIERTPVYVADEDNWKFSHTSNLIVFDGMLHLMWSNGEVHEDTAGQRILYATSRDGVSWSEPVPLMTPDRMRDDPKGALMSSGWHVDGDALLAYATWAPSARFNDFTRSQLWAVRVNDPQKDPVFVVPGTYLEGPQATGQGTWALLGQGADHQPLFFVTDNPDGVSDWQEAPFDVAPPSRWPEPSMFVRPDGSLVASIRTTRQLGLLWAVESFDGGRSWVHMSETDFPDAWARTSLGALPDGRCFIVSNPSTRTRRNVMSIALSKDGRLFDRAAALLIEPPPLKFEGRAKSPGWQYPSAVTWGDYLYVAYTVGKEDVEVLRVPIDELP
jgi:hypothetical protein